MIALFLLSTGLLGCGAGKSAVATASVRGKVVNRDKPVPHAQVNFIASSGPMSTGWTTEQGTFELQLPNAQRGAVIGESKVMIVTGLPLPAAPSDPPPSTDREVPARSSQEPSIQYLFAEPVLVKSGENEFLFDLSQANKQK